MSGNGRPPRRSNWGWPGWAAPGMSGPSYQRGRSSRAHWDPQLVRGGVREHRAQAPVHRVGVPRLDAVHGRAPRIHVEGAVHLFGPVVVVLEGRLVPAAQVEVELGEQRPGVVGAPEWAPNSSSKSPGQRVLRNASSRSRFAGFTTPPGGLLRLGGRLLVVGQEEEGPVAHQGSAERGAELVPPEVGLSAAPVRGVLGGDLVPLAEVVGGAGQLVGAGLGDDVDESPPSGRTPRGRPGSRSPARRWRRG